MSQINEGDQNAGDHQYTFESINSVGNMLTYDVLNRHMCTSWMVCIARVKPYPRNIMQPQSSLTTHFQLRPPVEPVACRGIQTYHSLPTVIDLKRFRGSPIDQGSSCISAHDSYITTPASPRAGCKATATQCRWLGCMRTGPAYLSSWSNAMVGTWNYSSACAL